MSRRCQLHAAKMLRRPEAVALRRKRESAVEAWRNRLERQIRSREKRSLSARAFWARREGLERGNLRISAKKCSASNKTNTERIV